MSFTIGALSRRFNTTPMFVCVYLSGFVSYLFPMYLFLLNNINGQNVFSYSNTCGGFKGAVRIFSASCANSIERTSASRPFIGVPSGYLGRKLTKTESVSPYTYFASQSSRAPFPYCVSRPSFA